MSLRAIRAGGLKRLLAGGAIVLAAVLLLQRSIGPGDVGEIEDVVEVVATSSDPVYCDELVTAGYLERTTGLKPPFGDESCEEQASVPGAEAVHVSEVQVDGSEATATVAYQGSALDGSTVVVRLVEVDEQWKLDRIRAFETFDRDGFEPEYAEQLLSSPFNFSPEGVGCIRARTRRLTDTRLEALLMDARRPTFVRFAIGCDRSAVESSLVDALEEGPHDHHAPGTVACFRRRLGSLSDERLVRFSADVEGYVKALFRCGRAEVLAAYTAVLEDSDFDASTVACLMRTLSAYPAARFARATYDEGMLAELVSDCED